MERIPNRNLPGHLQLFHVPGVSERPVRGTLLPPDERMDEYDALTEKNLSFGGATPEELERKYQIEQDYPTYGQISRAAVYSQRIDKLKKEISGLLENKTIPNLLAAQRKSINMLRLMNALREAKTITRMNHKLQKRAIDTYLATPKLNALNMRVLEEQNFIPTIKREAGLTRRARNGRRRTRRSRRVQ